MWKEEVWKLYYNKKRSLEKKFGKKRSLEKKFGKKKKFGKSQKVTLKPKR